MSLVRLNRIYCNRRYANHQYNVNDHCVPRGHNIQKHIIKYTTGNLRMESESWEKICLLVKTFALPTVTVKHTTDDCQLNLEYINFLQKRGDCSQSQSLFFCFFLHAPQLHMTSYDRLFHAIFDVSFSGKNVIQTVRKSSRVTCIYLTENRVSVWICRKIASWLKSSSYRLVSRHMRDF